MSEARPSIIAAVIVHGGRTLLVRRRLSEGSLSWQFPAGEQEPNEHPYGTAAREAAEEVGLTVRPVVLIGERQHPLTGRHMVYVGCEAEAATAILLDADELADLAWCDGSALKEKIQEGMFEPVADYLSHRLQA